MQLFSGSSTNIISAIDCFPSAPVRSGQTSQLKAAIAAGTVITSCLSPFFFRQQEKIL